MTIGVVLPPDSTPVSDEYIVNLVAPVSYGWTGISMGGQMSNSLLFTMWPYNSNIMLGPRWAECVVPWYCLYYVLTYPTNSDYVLPDPYAGPKITLLPASKVNSTHINAIFRCQVSASQTHIRSSHLTLSWSELHCVARRFPWVGEPGRHCCPSLCGFHRDRC